MSSQLLSGVFFRAAILWIIWEQPLSLSVLIRVILRSYEKRISQSIFHCEGKRTLENSSSIFRTRTSIIEFKWIYTACKKSTAEMNNNDSMFTKSEINFNVIQDSKQYTSLKSLARSNETKAQSN